MKEENINLPKKKHYFLKIFFIIILLIIIFLYIYVKKIEPNIITIKEYAIVDNNLPYSFHGMKIVHFSDILYGTTINKNNMSKIIDKINELKPDIVIYTGDLFNSNININESDKILLKENMTKILATYKKYAVIGDNDYINKNDYIDIMKSSGFIVLDNKNDLFYYGGNDPLMFIGTTSVLEKEIDIETADSSIENNTYYKIWLNHEPIIVDELKKHNINPNLIFAGHTLNGLIKLPFNSFLLTQDGINNYTNNYYNLDETKMYISNGLGTYKFNVRFNNLPSINLYRLYQY